MTDDTLLNEAAPLHNGSADPAATGRCRFPVKGRQIFAWPRCPLARVLAAAGCLLLVACDAGNDKRIGQALATVNGTDITVHQVNAELNGLPAQNGARPAELQRRALEAVIDRELLAAQAAQAKLDRDPAIMLAIERSRSQILAQAYLQSRAGKVRPTAAEIDDYIDKHPQLFSERKVYDLRYLGLPAASMDANVSAMVERARSLDELAASLGARNIVFTRGQSYRSSAELPPQLLANLDQVSKRPVFVMRDSEQTLLASLTYVKDDPVNGAQARRQADQFLTNRKSMETIHGEVARLRGAANIHYAAGSAAPAANPKAASEQPSTSPARTAIENGVSGLR
jgi:EpsD family peptidyl-prolyl cis-trans isomerase